MSNCELCNSDGGIVLIRTPLLRVVLAQNEPDYPAICRVILNNHISEMSDLAEDSRITLMEWVWHTEKTLRELLQPDKINLACLGNQVPHIHWHVIPRFKDDPHFPASIWGERIRNGTKHNFDTLEQQLRDKLSIYHNN